jgi:cytidine deaminase
MCKFGYFRSAANQFCSNFSVPFRGKSYFCKTKDFEVMKKTCVITYAEQPTNELTDADLVLVDKAIQALAGSYSPYSHFGVGAALKLDNGEIVCGANQENASYPCGTCAERSALNYAQTAFPNTRVIAIAIVARNSGSDCLEDFVSPCGLCRQALVEVEQKQASSIKVILAGLQRTLILDSVKDLLPFVFKF